jgi:hypothetical protein
MQVDHDTAKVSPKTHPGSSRRGGRRFVPRFSLAALLIFLTVISPPLAYIAQRRAWNSARISAYQSLKEKDYGLRMGLAPGNAPAQAKPSSLQRLWNSIVLDGQIPPFNQVQLLDGDGAQGPRPSPTDQDLIALALFHEIESIEIAHCEAITDRGLAAVANLPKLQRIQLMWMPNVTGAFLTELHDSKINWLWLEWLPNLEGKNLSAVCRLSNLRNFKLLKCPKLSDESLRDVSLPNQIQFLSLAELDISDATIARWLDQTQLKSLSLNVDISRAIAPSLSKQVSLDFLSICNAPLQDEDFAFLGQCTDLRQLSLRGLPVKGAFLNQIPNPDQMQFLDLSATLLDDENASALQRFPKMRTVNLSFTPIRGACFETQAKWPAWRSLDLGGTELSENGKNALAKLQGPQFVGLPLNWSQKNSLHYPGGKPAFNVGGGRTGLPYLHIDRIDRTPADQMAPVLRLHKLAKKGK